MKYGKIFTYENRHEAEIGKRYFFCDYYKEVISDEQINETRIFELVAVGGGKHPFFNNLGNSYQFIREIIEEPELMTNRQLSELIAKGYGEWKHEGSEVIHAETSYDEDKADDAIEDVLIRPWSSTEWRLPTVDIYEAFCHPVCKEDA